VLESGGGNGGNNGNNGNNGNGKKDGEIGWKWWDE
jgi:hypothetical protein